MVENSWVRVDRFRGFLTRCVAGYMYKYNSTLYGITLSLYATIDMNDVIQSWQKNVATREHKY